MIVFLIILLFSIFGKSDKECEKDSDCVLQQTTCCSCSMGGQEVCMSKQNASDYQEKLNDCQKDILCAAVYNCKESKCSCVNGKCQD